MIHRPPAPSSRGHRPADDEGIALLIVVMAMLIVSSLSLLVLGSIVSQATPAAFQRKNSQTINAAEAGRDVALAAIRNATYADGGDRSLLPCWSGQGGEIGDPGNAGLTYSVTVQYFKTDPSEQTEAWRTANAMLCTEGIGTATVPAFAFITADGAGPGIVGKSSTLGDRSIQSVYTFGVSNPNLPGGLIRDASGLCYQGGLTAGAAVKMAACLINSADQMWIFNSDFLIVLASTQGSSGSGGLCLSATPATNLVTTVGAVMKTCSISDYSQKWGVNNGDPVHFFGHLLGNYSYSWCLGAATPGAAGSVLNADKGCATGVYPQAAVGAGAAGTVTPLVSAIDGQALQWVNYKEFGRCLDITAWVLTTPSQILYPCKQDPMLLAVPAASPGWNEVFTWSSTSKYFWANATTSGQPSNPANPAYCMRSPNTNGGYVTFGTTCASIGSTAAAKQPFTWTVNRGETGSDATGYTIVDYYGRCLAAGPFNPSNAPNYSSAVTATCDGSDGQKWNAPASSAGGKVGDTAEVPNH